MSSPETTLARFTLAVRPDELPPSTAAAVRRLLLDALASAFAGRCTSERPAIERLAHEDFGPGRSRIIGGGTLAPAGAAFLNGFQVTAATVCDVHRSTLTHVTPEVVPAVLAAAQVTGAPGREVLAGLAAGTEVTVRVAAALDVPSYRARSWHNPGIAGAIGAAVAVARIRGCDEAGVRHAIGHAASQAAGTFAALGTSGVKLHQARGALSGFLAGSLAGAGLDAAVDGLTAPSGGLLAAYADGGEPERLTADLGRIFRLEEIALRRWPAASSLQPVIAATLAAREDAGVPAGGPGPGPVVAALVDLPVRAFALNGRSGWENQLAALQSARWIVAAVVHDGECWIGQTAPDRLADPRLGRFAAEAVAVREDPDLPATGARVVLLDDTGREHIRRVDVPPGDPAAPLTDAELRAKLERAVAGSAVAEAIVAGTSGRAAAIVAAIEDLVDAPSITLVADLLGA